MSASSWRKVADAAQSALAIAGACLVVKWAAQIAYAAGYSTGFN